jgi:acyl dehydratase
MPIDYPYLRSLRSSAQRVTYAERDTLFYALAIGMGRDPMNRLELPYVYEAVGLRTVPTLAASLIDTTWLENCGWEATRVQHAEERLILHRPLADSGDLLIDGRVAAVTEQGEGSGATIDIEFTARSAADRGLVFGIRRILVAGGHGSLESPAAPSALPPHRLPERPPDLVCSASTRSDQALLYRLCGDRRSLHADPFVARSMGLQAPVLQDLCAYGIACRSVLQTICEYDHTLIKAFDASFTAPVYPGETLVTEMWQAANIVSFRVRVEERNVTVLNHGRCILAT